MPNMRRFEPIDPEEGFPQENKQRFCRRLEVAKLARTCRLSFGLPELELTHTGASAALRVCHFV